MPLITNATPLILISGMISILSLGNVGAEQFGLFTYGGEVDGTVEITGFPEDLEIHVAIPAEINSKPVAAITIMMMSRIT
ncbi:MAG: hypothetical protein ACPGQF_06060 [Akkermansiaceae bacterium]